MSRRFRIPVIACLGALALAGPSPTRAQEFQVNNFTAGGQVYPAVAMSAQGEAVVVWHSQVQDAGTCGVFAQRFDALGRPTGPEFQVNTYSAGTQDWASVASSGGGRFVVVWTSYEQDGSDAGVFGRLFAPDGVPITDEFPVNTFTADRQKYPVVAMDEAGRFVVAWQSRYQDGSEDGIYAQRFDNHAQPLGTEFRVNSVTQGYQILPSIAMNADGRFVIAWTRDLQDGNGAKISMQRFAEDGSTLGGEVSVSSNWNFNQSNTAVGIDQDGGLTIAWDSDGQDGSSDGVYARRFHADGSPNGAEFLVNTTTEFAQRVAAVAMHPLGRCLVLWQSDEQDGSQWGIFGQAFDSQGAAVGHEFALNQYTAGMQMMPAVTVDADGDWIATWMSDGQDGSSFGIYAAYGAIHDPAAATAVSTPAAEITLSCPSVLRAGVPVVLSVVLARSGVADITVHDAQGALVRRLLNTELPRGRSRITWTTDRSSGRPAGSGVYFVRATTRGSAACARVVLLQ